MKPLIKWPGGKSSEFVHIESLIPNYNRYIEPFFGGGAIFFHLRPEKALINDISSYLMQFYNFIKTGNIKFKDAILSYSHQWKQVDEYVNAILDDLKEHYFKYRADESYLPKLVEYLKNSYALTYQLFERNFIINFEGFLKELDRNVIAKIERTRTLEVSNSALLSDKDLEDNIRTGFKGAFYMHFRNIYNDIALNRLHISISEEEKIANFYFIREYCYGSMFRYNASGEFNIPYGGISYNKKDFSRKIQILFDATTISYFKETAIYNKDFEVFLNSAKCTEDDFIFLDPPYDTDFSDYGGLSFNQQDQIRLANFIYTTKAKFILIIKNTDFIYQLYNHKDGIHILSFDKQYKYNVRSRNKRDTEHLVITNITKP